ESPSSLREGDGPGLSRNLNPTAFDATATEPQFALAPAGAAASEEITMNSEELELRKYLEAVIEVRGKMGQSYELAYSCAEDFVLKHGVWYPEPEFFPMIYGGQGAPKQCFGNALMLSAIYGLRYVEGYALAPVGEKGGRFPTLHGWNLDDSGRVVDSTWVNSGVAYVGITFSVERADDAIWNGDACVLDDYRRGYPVMRKPWTGETPIEQWSKSPRLELLRRKDQAGILRYLREELAE
ncbi:MAG: hypothetical protein ACRDQZ_07740, partial [Mycobacteriales bacterium]